MKTFTSIYTYGLRYRNNDLSFSSKLIAFLVVTLIYISTSFAFAQGNGPCIETDECFEFQYHGNVTLPNGNIKLKFKIITNCNHDLSYAVFGLPNGATAVSPSSNYAANFNYTIENATNNPFRSIKFEATNANGYKNGAIDIFEYVVTPYTFSNMSTVKVQAKAANKIGFVEFNINDCSPVTPCVAPVVQVQGAATVCLDSTVTFTANLTAGTATTYNWTLPNGWNIVSGQGTATLTATPGSASGNVNVTASNNCGNNSASLAVVVNNCGTTPPPTTGPCVLVDGCFEFRYLGATTLPTGNVKLKFEIQTNCNRDLSYAAFGLPNGATAVSPNNNYSAAFNYSIENATNNPFRSIKFEANNAKGYKNGVHDTFEFVVTASTFANMNTVKVQAKAALMIGYVEFDLDACDPNPVCVAPNVEVAGPDSVCELAGDAVTYTANLLEGTADTYVWTVPADWFIIDGQGTESILVAIGGLSGNVTVVATNECGTDTDDLYVVNCDEVIPLPVELISFNAARAQSAVLLNWSTASELNNALFEVERSKDGKNFDLIGKVAGNGTTTQVSEYSFKDTQPLTDVTYYRLKQIDNDGTFEYSPVRAVDRVAFGSTEPVKAYPNPTSGMFKLELPEGTPANATITIVSATGQTVYSGNANSILNANQQIDISRYTAGVYILNISSDTNKQSLRITKL